MRIHRGPAYTRPYKDRPWRLPDSTTIPTTVISSYPRASFHEVPKTTRQPSTLESPASFLPSGQTNPQWMKTLEEKYRKLHLKIDSYGDKSNSGSHQQNGTSFTQVKSTHYRNYHRPLSTFDNNVDLVRLGKSVLRFAKKTGKSEYLSKSARTLLGSQKSVKNKLVSINRHSQSDMNLGSGVLDSAETSRQADQYNSQEQTEGTPETSHGSFNLIMKTPRVHETLICDKQGYPFGETKQGVDMHTENYIEDNSEGYSVTNSESGQHDSPGLADKERLDTKTYYPGDPKYDQHQACPLNDNLEAYVELNFRPVTASPSCYSHPSTHHSARSRRPKTSLPTSAKSSQRLYRDSNRAMARNRLKVSDRRKLNVLQGMSEEAKFAITETKKEMHSKTIQRNGSAPHSGYTRGLNSNGLRPKSEKVVVQHRSNGVDYIADKQTSGVYGNGIASNSRQEIAIPASPAETLFDAESNPVDISLVSKSFVEPLDVTTKLPEIAQSKSKSSAYSKQPNQSSSQSGNFSSVRRIAREKTFQITAPDYDVRFREVLSCDIPDSETPTPDIKAEAVAKCSEWLNKRCAQHYRIVDSVS